MRMLSAQCPPMLLHGGASGVVTFLASDPTSCDPQVICSDATLAAAKKALQAGRSTWRVSSTVFAHIASDQTLRPLACFDSPAACQQYPEVLAGHQVEQELSALNLKA